MFTKESLPLIICLVTVLATVIGWFVSHRLAHNTQLRKDRLELVNRQLAEFYGPLHIACVVGSAAYDALSAKLGRHTIFEANKPLTDSEFRNGSTG